MCDATLCSDDPFPPQGPFGQVPPVQRYYESLRLLAVLPRRLRYPSRFGYWFSACLFVIPPAGIPVKAPWSAMLPSRDWLFCIPHAGAAYLDSDTARSLTFPGYPLVYLPCSQTPAGPNHQVFQWFGVAPALSTTKAPTNRVFRGSIAWLLNSLSTLHTRESPQEHARLASDCLPGFIGWD